MALKKQVITKTLKSNVLDTHKETEGHPSIAMEISAVQGKYKSNGLFPLIDSKGKTLPKTTVFIPDPKDCWI